MQYNLIFHDKMGHMRAGGMRKASTGQSAITKLFTTKFVRKNSPCLVQQRQILVLRRQNGIAPECTGDKTSRHEKFWASNVKTKNLMIRVR